LGTIAALKKIHAHHTIPPLMVFASKDDPMQINKTQFNHSPNKKNNDDV
jgi:hypothetical protein